MAVVQGNGRPDKKAARLRSLKFRFLLLGVLAGIIPLAVMVASFRLVSHSLREDLSLALADIRTREVLRLQDQQHTLLLQQMRDKVLNVTEHLSHTLEANPRSRWEELSQNPHFRDDALQPIGIFGETFLLDPTSDRILMHTNKELEGEGLRRLFPYPTSLPSLEGNRTLYEFSLTSLEEGDVFRHLFLVRVPIRAAGGPEIMVGALPDPGEIHQIIAPTAAIFKTALNQSQALLDGLRAARTRRSRRRRCRRPPACR